MTHTTLVFKFLNTHRHHTSHIDITIHDGRVRVRVSVVWRYTRHRSVTYHTRNTHSHTIPDRFTPFGYTLDFSVSHETASQCICISKLHHSTYRARPVRSPGRKVADRNQCRILP